MEVEEERDTDEAMETDSSPESESCHFSAWLRVAPDESKKQVSVLMLTPQWRFDEYGMATITRSLVQNLRMIDPDGTFIKITCAVLEEDGKIREDQLRNAKKLGVELIGYKIPKGRKRAVALHWLDEDVAKYYLHVVSQVNYDFIIGHAPYLTNGCLNMRKGYSDMNTEQTPKVILMVHALPQNENGELDVELLSYLFEADMVVSMEKSTHEKLSTRFMSVDQEKTPDFKMYFPVFPSDFFQIHRQERTENGKILMMTKERKSL